MAHQQPTARNVLLAKAEDLQRDANGHWEYKAGTRGYPTRAVQPTPRFDLITPIIALDGEFQLAKVESTGKHIQRIGRISIVNYFGHVIFDAFVHYPDEDGFTKKLPPRCLGLGVYKQDVQLRNGALPIHQVEQIVRAISKDCVNVGHAFKNDIAVFHPFVFDGVKKRDTQMLPEYRQYATGSRRLPKLSVLAKEILNVVIQGVEHSSVEDAQATMLLYRHREAEFEVLQSQDVHYASLGDLDEGFVDWEDVEGCDLGDLENQVEAGEECEVWVLPPIREAEVAKAYHENATFWKAKSSALKESLAADKCKNGTLRRLS
ncbi:uncharacterized protein RCC_07216 [Ramularia collo-cygni]|uniref:Exonuclease domain-containing protein n=1 Tax=Ramularia collo-cygni TaxID=112498 RepID=A0A2D3VK48_9PEZI|nr:uncharacterized protein RCC_07216 [Ramularia collo-cygni]CZT21353.1 uncharacterized protein RCC_07216 [Ramularia collo-cygni]